MERVLVTGGAGYVGSVVTEALYKNGFPVVVVDDLRDSEKKVFPSGTIFYEQDCGDADALRGIIDEHGISIVMHLAASANVPQSVVSPAPFYQNNVAGTITLLRTMAEAGVNKFVFSSTAAVYGEPEYSPIDEDHPLNPVNPYGRSKLMIEQIIEDFHKAYGLQYIALRYFCAAGATSENGESRKSQETHLIPLVIDTALGKRPHVEVFGSDYPTKDGTGIRDYIHVSNIATAHILAMEALDNVSSGVLNLGTGNGYSVLEVIEATQRVLGCKIPRKHAPSRPGDPASLVASHKKAQEVLGWSPKHTLEDIIRSTYEWRNHPQY